MRGKKASLFGGPLVLLLSFTIIIILILMFFVMFDFKKSNTFTVKDVEEQSGDNLFLVGLLRQEVASEKIPLSEVIAKYNAEKEDRYSSIIKTHINLKMKEMFSKNVCWTLTIPTDEIVEDSSDCQSLSKEDYILASTKIPGFNKEVFDITFESKK